MWDLCCGQRGNETKRVEPGQDGRKACILCSEFESSVLAGGGVEKNIFLSVVAV